MNNLYDDKKGRYEIDTVTIETVDQAVYDYFDKKIVPTVETERGRNRVEVVFVGGERWKLIRKTKFRDKNGTLILPLISIERTDIDRTRGFGGMAQETPEITISKRIHSKTGNIQKLLKTRRINGFPEARKDKVVYETLTLPFPDFCQIYYEITIWTQFRTQMNEILEKIFYNYNHLDSFVMPVNYDGKNPKGEGYYFVGFREGNVTPQENTKDFTDQERILKSIYIIKTPVYLMLDPKDETLSYGRDREGKKVVYKQQSSLKTSFKEEVLTLEEFEKLYG